MVRKMLLLAALITAVASASAQRMHRSEVSLSYGLAPVTDWVDTYSSLLERLYHGSGTSLSGWGAVTAGYNFRLTGGISLGVQVVYSSNEQTLRHARGSIETRYWSVMPDIKWNWMNLKIVSLYSRVAAGPSFSRAKADSHEESSTKFAFQLSPIGLEVGGRLAAYAEAGIGSSGCFLVGARYRF